MAGEFIYLLVGLLGGLVMILIWRAKSVPRDSLTEMENRYREANTQTALFQERLQLTQVELLQVKDLLGQKTSEGHQLLQDKASLSAAVEQFKAFADRFKTELESEKMTNQRQQEEIGRLQRITSEFQAGNQYLQEKLNTQKAELEEFRRTSQLEFSQMADKILEEKVSKFTEKNKENLDHILKPLGENIEQFKKKVEETYDIESKQRFSLEEKVKELMEQSNRISQEANNLTNALRGQAKKQGNWGEVILESILEKSGLQKNREYKIQATMQNEEGQVFRPDVLIFLPEERSIVVDSKVSLTAYDRYCAAETKDEQEMHLQQHLASLYQHIDDLSRKRYDELTKGLDFTMMFIPIEPAYLLAIQEDQNMWNYAYNKRILLISPTNLIAALKLISDLWKREQQNKNAMEIAKQGERLYEKIVGFLDTMEDIEKHINKTQETFLKAKKQLKDGKGNMVSQAQKLKSMGINSDKMIPEHLGGEEDQVD